jgi:type III restriction enzyme
LGLADVHTAWTEVDLVRWLDRQVRQRDVRQETMLEFVRRSVAYLIGGRGLSLTALNRFKYPLEKALLEKIKKNRAAAAASTYQEVLFGASAAVETTFELPTVFSLDTYAPRWLYAGHPYVFRKHFHPLIGELKNTGEEFDCAQVLDTLPQVKYWVRNIERTDNSFGLPTSTDKLYPDFVTQLEDGRILVVEYKGKIYMQIDDSKEKQQIGALWEEKSGGKGLFIMVEKKDVQGRDMRAQLMAKIGKGITS